MRVMPCECGIVPKLDRWANSFATAFTHEVRAITNNISQFYNLFGDFVGLTGCVCLCIVIVSMTKRGKSPHLAWLVPLAGGHILASIAAIVYALSPGYWNAIAHSGSYPLFVMGAFAGLLLMYGWVQLAVVFLRDIPVIQLVNEVQETSEHIWPPPPVKP